MNSNQYTTPADPAAPRAARAVTDGRCPNASHAPATLAAAGEIPDGAGE